MARSFSASGVPPGSRVSVTTRPWARKAAARLSMWVDLPAPSMPSKLMKSPVRLMNGPLGEALPMAVSHCPRWNLLTARLCSSSVALNWLVPSPRATKYSALVMRRLHRRQQGALARHGNRRGRQPGAGVGVPGRVGQQVAPAQVAVELVAQAVDDGGVGLQHHADAQAVVEHAGDHGPVAGAAGFLLDDAGQDQRLVGALERRSWAGAGPRRPPASCPSRAGRARSTARSLEPLA